VSDRLPGHAIEAANFRKKPYSLTCQCEATVTSDDREALAKVFMEHRAAARGTTPSRQAGNPIAQRKQNRTFVRHTP
jgi:hypothetical protein